MIKPQRDCSGSEFKKMLIKNTISAIFLLTVYNGVWLVVLCHRWRLFNSKNKSGIFARMKAALKHILVILLALCYCLAVGGNGNGGIDINDRMPLSSETAFVPGAPDKLAAHIPQTAFVEAFAKYGQPQNFKLTFHALAPIPQFAGHFISQPFRQYVRKSQNMHILTIADIIYPFHSFW